MTKKEMFEEMERIMETHSLSKSGAYNTLLQYIFDYFDVNQIEELLNHIKEKMGEN